MKTYKLKLTAISPIHIGTGEEYEPINYVIDKLDIKTADGKIIYHFDCYRINKIQEALDLGAEEYLYSGNYCFIEWSENIEDALPDNTIYIDIRRIDDNIREITIQGDERFAGIGN